MRRGMRCLSALAHVITTGIRTEDIACRYGGEEFLLIMPGASLETTRERAENLRQAVKALQVKYQDQSAQIHYHLSGGGHLSGPRGSLPKRLSPPRTPPFTAPNKPVGIASRSPALNSPAAAAS